VTLAETQALFCEAITSAEPLARRRLEACFAGTDEFPATERVTLYAEMYGWRLVDALREIYPRLARFLGDGEFAALAQDYLKHHPSTHHDIGRAGHALPGFLRRFPDPDRPDLADLAELEWTRHTAFFSENSAAVGADAFAKLAPGTFARARIAFTPALRILALRYAVTGLWRCIEDGVKPEPPVEGASAVAVWRRGFEVLHGPISLEEAKAFSEALEGKDLAQICASFAKTPEPAAAAHAALSSWIEEGWIAAIVVP